MTDRTDERDWQRLRELFAAAGEMSATEREAFLDRELANEPTIRAELATLFISEASATEFLTSSKTDPIQRTIGPYRLVKLLGEGGFGIVYLAEQDRPLRRRVALKLIKPGMDTKQVIARFDAERQALAFMDHPGIAQVHDAGETETGRPYFVMEYVQGVPITAFCDESALPVRERLELFLEVCDAIQHAHQKGVIHRDIKPSNVLVTRRDGVAIPKVIDFGIAKATGAGLADRTIATHEGVILGTLGSMSPEQAGAIEAVVDTRSDIYSLGVLLYELLTGQPPFDPARLRQISWTEAVRSIREQVPPAPSARVASQPDDGDVARRRGLERSGLLRELKGDLDWITMRALEKEPGRRYASASEFAADIRRHLQGQPVLAGAPSTGYRLRKFVRRHRVGVLAGSLVLLALLVGGVATGIGFRRALRAEKTARREAASAEQVSAFLVDLFRTASPDRSKGETVTARTLLGDGARRIRASLKDDPEIRARLLTTLGKTHLSLGLDEEGLALLREALAVSESARPRDEMDVAAQLLTLADGYRTTQQPDSIGPLLERAMATARAAGEPGTAWRADYLWQESRWRNMRGETPAADSLITAAIALAESESEPHRVKLIGMYATKAGIAHREFDLKDAVANYERALQLAEEADDQPMWVANLHGYLASVYSALNEPDKAVLHANEGVRLAKQLYAPDHPSIARAMEGLAAALLSKQDYEGAAKVREEIVATLRSNDAPKYALAQALNSLAIAYQASGKIDLAIARTEEACAAYRDVYGTENARTAEAMGNLARLYADAGQTVRADSLFLTALGVFGRLDPKGFFTAYTRMRYANLCRDTRRFVRADSLYLAAEAELDSTQAGQRAYLGECFIDHACLLSLQGRHTEAQALIPVGVALDFEGADEKNPELGRAYVQWALVSARAGRPEIAIEKLRLAAGCGVPAESVVAYPELASLRGRADYPFVSSP